MTTQIGSFFLEVVPFCGTRNLLDRKGLFQISPFLLCWKEGRINFRPFFLIFAK